MSDPVSLDRIEESLDDRGDSLAHRADAGSEALPDRGFKHALGERLNDIWEAGATQVLSKASSSPKPVVETIRAVLANRPA